ncbi:MAG: hypothetical protein QF578_12730 [Alphaproteobacteria bacterium]|jgi:hypothetical protein|nr:hypothetical protein [Alphaproteobacteria bacterium]
MKARSTALRARAIELWPVFEASFGAYRQTFINAGCDARQADQIATILAGRDLLLCDVEPDDDSLTHEVGRCRELLEAAAAEEDEGEGEQCLNHLMSSPVDIWRSGLRRTVAQVIIDALAADPTTAGGQRAGLGTIGLRLEGTGGDVRIAVANRHVGLERLFNNTRWQGGAWVQALHYLDGAEAIAPKRFAGVQSRCTLLDAKFTPSNGIDDPEFEEESESMDEGA